MHSVLNVLIISYLAAKCSLEWNGMEWNGMQGSDILLLMTLCVNERELTCCVLPSFSTFTICPTRCLPGGGGHASGVANSIIGGGGNIHIFVFTDLN